MRSLSRCHARQRGDSNPCGQSPMDFESISLAARTHCLVHAFSPSSSQVYTALSQLSSSHGECQARENMWIWDWGTTQPGMRSTLASRREHDTRKPTVRQELVGEKRSRARTGVMGSKNNENRVLQGGKQKTPSSPSTVGRMSRNRCSSRVTWRSPSGLRRRRTPSCRWRPHRANCAEHPPASDSQWCRAR